VSKGPEALVRDEVRALKAYHVPPAEGLVKLDAMENPYTLPPELAAELGERLRRVAVNRYPDPAAPRLHARIREAMGIPGQLGVMLGNGSDELLQMISLALAKPGAVALGVDPSFVMYRMSAIAAGMRYEAVPLRPDFSLDEEALLAAIRRHRPALTWLAYPNNPTGNLFPREAILASWTLLRGSSWWTRPTTPFPGVRRSCRRSAGIRTCCSSAPFPSWGSRACGSVSRSGRATGWRSWKSCACRTT